MRIVVCGAGIAGLTVADRFVSGGHEVVMLERAPVPRLQYERLWRPVVAGESTALIDDLRQDGSRQVGAL